MTDAIPSSLATYYLDGSRYGERLTFAAGRNAYDGTSFVEGDIRFRDLLKGIYAPHLGDPGRGSLVTDDGRHVAVPHLVGKLVEAARRAGASGNVLAGGGAGAAAIVAMGGAMPETTLGIAGAGVAVKVAAMAVALVGKGAVAAAMSETRRSASGMEGELSSSRMRTDEMAGRLKAAADAMRVASGSLQETVDGAREAAGFEPRPTCARNP